jgi:hypothetical protein
MTGLRFVRPPSVDEQVDYFNLAVHDLFVRHVLLRRGRPRFAVNPWYNTVIEKTIIDRNLDHRFGDLIGLRNCGRHIYA